MIFRPFHAFFLLRESKYFTGISTGLASGPGSHKEDIRLLGVGKDLPFPDPVQKFFPQHACQMTDQSLLEYLQWDTLYFPRQLFKY